MTLTTAQRVITGVHPQLSADTEPTPVITLAPTSAAALSIDDKALSYTQGSAATVTFALASYTLAGLVSALPAFLHASLSDSTWAGVSAQALEPFDAIVLSTSLTYGLGAYTSGLWRVMKPIIDGLTTLETQITALLAQADLRIAAGSWLDAWGQIWGVPRLAAESDANYRARMIYILTLPQANNKALELLIAQAFGVSARVTDDYSLLFTLNGTNPADIIGPTSGSGGVGPQKYGSFRVEMKDPGYPVSAITAFIDAKKARAMTYTLVLTYSPRGQVAYGNVQAQSQE